MRPFIGHSATETTKIAAVVTTDWVLTGREGPGVSDESTMKWPKNGIAHSEGILGDSGLPFQFGCNGSGG